MSDRIFTLSSLQHTICIYYCLVHFVTKLHSAPLLSNGFHVRLLVDEYWNNEMCVYVYICACVCVCVCVCIRIIFWGGDEEGTNIFTLQLQVIQTINVINKCTSCRQIFKDYNLKYPQCLP